MFTRKNTVMRTRKYGKLFRFGIVAAVIIIASCLIAYGWQKYEEEKHPEGDEGNYSLPNAFLDFAQLVTDFFTKDEEEAEDPTDPGSENEDGEEEKVTEITVGENNSDSSSAETESEAPPAAKGGTAEETEAASESSLSTALFVGDYFVYYAEYMGYCSYAKTAYATDYDLNTLLSKNVMHLEDKDVSFIDYIASVEGVNAVYIMFSAESISWMDYPTFVKKYESLIDGIAKAQPEAVIYVQSILPINSEAAEKRGYSVTNEKIDRINAYLASVAEEKEFWYLDLAPEFKDENGELPSENTANGIRLSDEAYALWYDYILTHKMH